MFQKQSQFVSKGAVNNMKALVQIIARHLTGEKPLSKPSMSYCADTYALLGLDELNGR